MSKIEIIAIPSIKIIEDKDDLISIITESLDKAKLVLQDDDILVIASKVVSVVEGGIVNFSSVSPSEKARKLAEKAHMPPEFAQIILEESNGNYIGLVPGAITTLNHLGLLANAGADQSNTEENSVIKLPQDCNKSAQQIHDQLKMKTGKYLGIILADSRTTPLRLGTVGCALGTFGFQAIIDERGTEDLFGKPMHITVRAIADQLATAAEIVMGETNERTPFVLIRGYPITRISKEEEQDINSLIPADQCMFIGPLLNCLKEKSEGEIKDD